MKFGETPLAEAEGAILAHGLKAGKQVFKKGRVLSSQDLAALADAGIERLVVARLEPGDVGEDEAAARLAGAVAGPHLETSAAFTGRCNLFAEAPGIADYDLDALARLNRIDEALTVAAVPAFERLETGRMVATIKVIPFAVHGAVLERFEAAAARCHPVLAVAPFRPGAVGLVQSRLPGTRQAVLEKTVGAVGGRLADLGNDLVAEHRCAHDDAEIAEAIAAMAARPCTMILVSGASAITDRRDVVPAAIERAGGRIEHFGMPVDPGNLLLLARLADGTPVIGLPGCARSPRRNGFDWVLERLLAGLDVGPDQVRAMGAGGLLKEVPGRPLPRADATRRETPTRPRAPRIGAVVLAAGQSRRMGRDNKLLARIDGRPMVERVVDAVADSKARPVVVVVGHQADAVRRCLEGHDVRFVHNPDFAHGLSTSLAHGLGALPDDVDGAVVCLGDMPRVRAAEIDRLIAAFDPAEGRTVCVPTHRAKRGNPVLWGRRFFAEMAGLKGDVGARHLIGEYWDAVVEVEMVEDGVLVDIDTPDALTRLADATKPGS
jgi:molybdenum cofactor cytidylyltransferase